MTKLHGDVPDRETLLAMIGTLSYRGPDDMSMQRIGPTGFAHARLSIIDLEGGSQPMSIDHGKLWITFNGEIFNYVELRKELADRGHRFATQSDTEVILHLYEEEGENCTRRLNGQWAFAIWDVPRQKLFLSRDRMGVRPLFYTRTPDSFLFASEIKSLMASGEVDAQLDLEALDQIFTFWVTLPPRTAFRNISQLPPGHSLVLEQGKVRTWRYWALDYETAPISPTPTIERKLSEDLLNLLFDATRIRLRADVPVGAYLSGGLDSTVIAALAHVVVGDRLRTFSVSFEDSEFDETRYQQEASSFLHTQHARIDCSYPAIADCFPDVVWHAEQPILRTAPAPLLLLAKLVRDSGFKVVLTGEGADELLGGYDIFKEAKIRRFWGKHLDSHWRPLLLKRLYPYMDGIQRQSPAYLQSFFQVSEENLASPFFSHLPRWQLTSKLKMFFSDAIRHELLDSSPITTMEEQLPPGFLSWTPFNQAEYLDAAYLLPGYILSSQGDRMAMAHSVEGRHPFLDHRVVRFASRLPANLKMKVLDQKHILKRAARGMIPSSILQRPKQPYRAPDGKSFYAFPNDYVEEMLSPKRIAQDGIFDPRPVGALCAKFKAQRTTSVKDNMALVGILSTQLLLHQFIHHKTGQFLCDHNSLQTFTAS